MARNNRTESKKWVPKDAEDAEEDAPKGKAKSQLGSPPCSYDYSGLEVGMRVQALSEGTWYAAEVLAVSNQRMRAKAPVRIAYVGHQDYDEWVAGDRLRSRFLRRGGPAGAEHGGGEPSAVAAGAAELPEGPMTLHYFSVWAKGPAPAIALNHSGLEWRGLFADRADWSNFKQATPWGALPVLEVPGVGKIGHEAAILNYLARISKVLGNMSARDYATSQQLLSESEDIYCALQRVQPTFKAKDKPKAAMVEFWSKDDSAEHNRTQGLKV